MAKAALKKEKWTLTFEPRLKAEVVREARRIGVYPVAVLEQLVRDRFNPFGHTDIKSSTAYVQQRRRRSAEHSDDDFLEEIRAWQRSRS